MTAPNTKKPPTEIFFVTNGSLNGAYWTQGALRGALKNNNSWTRSEYNDYGWVKHPHPALVILRSEIGSTEGWKDVTEAFVKDGTWAW